MSFGRLRVVVLGPLRVWAGTGEPVRLSGDLQRRLLAFLVLRRGSVVSPDSAADALWPVGLPRDPVAALQNHVSRLRQRLPEGVVESVGSGYRIDPTCVDVDSDRLEALLVERPGAAVVELRRILAGWQGVAYPDLDDNDEARVEATRLEELRERAREVVAEARLSMGDLDGLVVELAALAEDRPLRERPRELLMSALAASGRTAEALRVFDDFRRLLGDELGIEPSPTLAKLNTSLLAGDGLAGRRPLRSRLPMPPTPLVGRGAAVEELVGLATSHRLVTLVGPGGVGKTRLLVELAARLRQEQPERGVVWCDLTQADVASTHDVVAAALGIDARRGVDLVNRIVEVVGDDELVVLLDNCEHVLDPIAALVDAVVGGCPNVAVAASSRERLRAAGEQVWVVPTLRAHDAHAPAVELFCQRALAVSSSFAPDADQRAAIVEIVSRLDGLPLAIELAAARLVSLEVGELAEGLDQRFELLSIGSRTSPRHSSLAAAVSWSFDSLDDELQRSFAALSVFSRPFESADAAAVCGIDVASVTGLLSTLVEQSLVQRALGRRYVLLETLKAYGAEQLIGSGDADRVGERHARWMVDWVEAADRALTDPSRSVLAEIDEAIPELRVALAWLVGHGMADHAGRLVIGLMDYGLLRLRPDVLAWADAALAADPEDLGAAAPALYAASAYASWMAGDVVRALELVEHAMSVERRHGRRPTARVRTMRGNIDLFEGRLSNATEWYRQAIDAAADDEAERTFNRATELLSLGYAGDAAAPGMADQLIRDIGDAATAPNAYMWYCAGEADLSFDVDRARVRLVRAIELAEATNASFVAGSRARRRRRSKPPWATPRWRWPTIAG